jgi:hypothetical protein
MCGIKKKLELSKESSYTDRMKNKNKYDMDAVLKARDFFEAMNEAKKAMKEYDECDGPDSNFWRVPESIQRRYYLSMETFGKFLA